jgi:Co/Zn/Cd efflux system component
MQRRALDNIGMALASIPSPTTDASTSQMDAYLLEVYRQAAESARPSAYARLVGLGAFLTIVSLLTVALVVLFSVLDGSSEPLRAGACVALGAIGLVVSTAFYALELRRHHAHRRDHSFDQPAAYATSSIYQASIGFFAFVVVIATALLLVR